MKAQVKVAVGSDHAGFSLKETVKAELKARSFEVVDVGTNNSDSVDYPDYALKLGKLVSDAKVDTGIMVCGTGMGVTVLLNKLPGIVAANCFNKKVTSQARAHLNANVMALGGTVVRPERVKGILDAWFKTEYEGGRHERRMKKVRKTEAKFLK